VVLSRGAGLGRQPNREGGADPELALDADRSAVALHDTQAHGQSETGPADLGLGREERLEDTAEVLRRDACAGVCYLDPHRVAAALRTERLGGASLMCIV